MRHDTELVTDISLFLINTREFYEHARMLRKNYAKKMREGKYDPDLAVRGLDPFVRRYISGREFKRLYADMTVTTSERRAICANILEHWDEEMREDV